MVAGGDDGARLRGGVRVLTTACLLLLLLRVMMKRWLMVMWLLLLPLKRVVISAFASFGATRGRTAAIQRILAATSLATIHDTTRIHGATAAAAAAAAISGDVGLGRVAERRRDIGATFYATRQIRRALIVASARIQATGGAPHDAAAADTRGASGAPGAAAEVGHLGAEGVGAGFADRIKVVQLQGGEVGAHFYHVRS